MKKIAFIYCITATLFFQKALSQNSDNIYIKALSLYIKNSTSTTQFPKLLYIKELSAVTYKFPDSIENIKLIILNDSQIKKITGTKKTLYIIRINPISILDDKCTLYIGGYDVSYKNRILNYESLGGTEILIRYNCDNKIYVLDLK